MNQTTKLFFFSGFMLINSSIFATSLATPENIPWVISWFISVAILLYLTISK